MSDDDDCACLSVLVVCVILVPVYWLIVALGPLSFYPRVDSAVLAALDSSTTPPPDSTDAIRYNLSVDLSFNNSHPQVEIQYLSVAVAAFYGDFMLGLPDRTFPTPFSQGPSNTTVRASEVTSPSNSWWSLNNWWSLSLSMCRCSAHRCRVRWPCSLTWRRSSEGSGRQVWFIWRSECRYNLGIRCGDSPGLATSTATIAQCGSSRRRATPRPPCSMPEPNACPSSDMHMPTNKHACVAQHPSRCNNERPTITYIKW